MKISSTSRFSFVLIVTIAIGCSDNPLDPQYSQLHGEWRWVKTYGMGEFPFTLTASNTIIGGLDFGDGNLYEYYFSVGMGRGIPIGLTYDSVSAKGLYSLSQSSGSLEIQFNEIYSVHIYKDYGTIPLPLTVFNQRIDRLTADTLDLTDVQYYGYTTYTYARIR